MTNLIKGMILYDMPKYIKQKIINQIVENGIGTYKTKKEPELVQLKNKTINEKILECLDKDSKTIKVIDLVEINKGYKYLGFFDYTSLDLVKLESKIQNIQSDYYKTISDEKEELKPLFIKDNDAIYIKFHHKIKVLQKEPSLEYFEVRYPVVFVIHEKLSMFEVRFDKINIEDHKEFYEFCLKDGLNWLEKNVDLKYKYINLDEIIRMILEDKNKIARDLIWAGELKNSQGLTIKAGSNMDTFFDDFKKHLNMLDNKYRGHSKAEECLKEVEEFIDNTLDLAADKFRTIRWNKYEEDNVYKSLHEFIDFKITFNYGGKMLDIINIYDSEKNDMERIEYVSKIIGKFRRSLR